MMVMMFMLVFELMSVCMIFVGVLVMVLLMVMIVLMSMFVIVVMMIMHVFIFFDTIYSDVCMRAFDTALDALFELICNIGNAQ